MIRTIAILMLISSCMSAHAGNKDTLILDRISGGSLGLWAIGDGDQTWVDLHCLASSNYNNAYTFPPPIKSPPAVHELYRFKVTDLAASAGYYLYLNDDELNTGNARIMVSFSHRDVMVGTTFEMLNDDTYGAHSHEGQFARCKDGSNSELQLVISSTELSKAQAGQYTGNFQVTAIGGSSGTATQSQSFSFTLDVAQSVRVSALNNIALGTWVGMGNLSASETFCIFSNNTTAGYSVTISSSQQDALGNFRLVDGTLSAYLNYSLSFANTLTGPASSVTTLPLSGVGINTDPACGGMDNARLRVDLLEADLLNALVNVYSDTITIMVVPI